MSFMTHQEAQEVVRLPSLQVAPTASMEIPHIVGQGHLSWKKEVQLLGYTTDVFKSESLFRRVQPFLINRNPENSRISDKIEPVLNPPATSSSSTFSGHHRRHHRSPHPQEHCETQDVAGSALNDLLKELNDLKKAVAQPPPLLFFNPVNRSSSTQLVDPQNMPASDPIICNKSPLIDPNSYVRMDIVVELVNKLLEKPNAAKVPEIFHLNTTSLTFEEWADSCLQYGQSRGLTKNKLVRHCAHNFLTGDARYYFYRAYLYEFDDNWDKFVHRGKLYFDLLESQKFSKFLNIRQKKDETIKQYSARANALFLQQASLPDCLGATDVWIRGMNPLHNETARLMYIDKKSFCEAIAFTQEMRDCFGVPEEIECYSTDDELFYESMDDE